jgi:hypothetical protein
LLKTKDKAPFAVISFSLTFFTQKLPQRNNVFILKYNKSYQLKEAVISCGNYFLLDFDQYPQKMPLFFCFDMRERKNDEKYPKIEVDF